MLAFRARERYAEGPITEAHPKALLHILGLRKATWQAMAARFGLIGPSPMSEHERDAVLAAVAARNGFTGQWSRDLSLDRDVRELDPRQMWFGLVNYHWPD